MNLKIKKVCGFNISSIHFSMMILPYIKKELEAKKDVITILEANLEKNINQILSKLTISDEEKEKFFVQLGASVEIFFPNKKPEELSDSLILWTTPEGKITDAEYSYEEPENEQFVQMPVPEKDLKAFVEAFKDFTLEFDSD